MIYCSFHLGSSPAGTPEPVTRNDTSDIHVTTDGPNRFNTPDTNNDTSDMNDTIDRSSGMSGLDTHNATSDINNSNNTIDGSSGMGGYDTQDARNDSDTDRSSGTSEYNNVTLASGSVEGSGNNKPTESGNTEQEFDLGVDKEDFDLRDDPDVINTRLIRDGDISLLPNFFFLFSVLVIALNLC